MIVKKKSVYIYICSIIILLIVFVYANFYFKGSADINNSLDIPSSKYSLGMTQPLADLPEKVPGSTVKLFDDLNLSDTRYLLYALPKKDDVDKTKAILESSFVRSDRYIKFASQRKQNILLTIFLSGYGKDFTPECTGSGSSMQCNFDWLNIVPDIVHRLDGDCDFNNDGDCNDVVYGQKEVDGPIGKVTTFQIFHRVPGVPIFRNDEGAAIYAAMFKEISKKIKQECASCKIVFPGLTGGRDDIYPFDMGLDMRTLYLKNILQNLGEDKNLIDVFDIQYRGVTDEPYYAYQKMQEIYYRFRQVIDQAQLENVPIWMTEISAYTESPQKPWDTSLNFTQRDETEHTKGLIREIMFAYSLGISKVFHAPLSDKTQQIVEDEIENPCYSYFCYSGLLFRDDTPKKAYNAFKFINQKVIPNAQEIILRRDDNVKIIEIKYPNNRKAYIAWNDAGAEEVNLTCSFGQSIQVTNIITNSTTTVNNALIKITDEPVFIQGNYLIR